MESNINLAIEEVTPEVARIYLEHNKTNRPIDKRLVNYYAKEMVICRWRENYSEPVVFSSEGDLIDGQHRLNAIMQAGVPVRMAVMRGVDPDDIFIINTGKTRSAGDALTMDNVKSAKVIVSIIKYYQGLKIGRRMQAKADRSRSLGLTNKEICDEYHNNETLYENVKDFALSVYQDAKYLRQSETGGICVYLVKEKGWAIDDVAAFYKKLLGSDSGYMKKLHKDILNSFIGKYVKMSANKRVVLLSKAWNLFVKGKEQKQLYYKDSDTYKFVAK